MALGISLEEVLQGMNQGPLGSPVNIPEAQPQPQHHGKGQLILGILADALAGATGRPGPYAHMMDQRRQAEDEDYRWTRRRESNLADYEAQKQIDQRYQGADISPMERDSIAWGRMTPEQHAAYKEMHPGQDPDVFTTLPNGQFYAGPRSGLAAALGGGQVPTAPVGRLTPLNGGPTPPASGGFPRSY